MQFPKEAGGEWSRGKEVAAVTLQQFRMHYSGQQVSVTEVVLCYRFLLNKDWLLHSLIYYNKLKFGLL